MESDSRQRVVTVFIGSVRPGRIGDKVAEWIASGLTQRGYKVHLIDPLVYDELLTLELPFHYSSDPSPEMREVHDLLVASDGFVLVTPEYNHSFSGALKNAIDNFMPEYKRKPFGIASYSVSSLGGVRANEALRIVVSELKGVPTPIPLLVPHAHDAFDEQGRTLDDTHAKHLQSFLDDFCWYVEALGNARTSEQ